MDWRADRVERAWADAGFDLRALAERYPPREANRSSRELEPLVAAVGLDIRPKLRLTRPSVSSVEPNAWSLAQPFLEYLERPDVRPRAPAALKDYFDASATDVDAIRDHLLNGPIVDWEGGWPEHPVPNFLGHLRLQRLLLARARAASAEGDRDRAILDLEASWRLSLSLRSRAEFISHGVLLEDARLRARIVRDVVPPAETWLPRLEIDSHQDEMLEGLQARAWMWITGARNRDDELYLGLDWWTTGKYRRGIREPSYRWALAGFGYERLDQAQWTRDTMGCGVALPPDHPDRDQFARLPQLLLDLELARKVLRVHEERAAIGDWPETLPGIEHSECSGERWSYQVVKGGFDLWLSTPGTPSWRAGWHRPQGSVSWQPPRHEERR